MITKTEIVVFKAIDYSESSQITTVLSRKHGKISLIAKGSRKPKSRFAGKLQPGNLLDVVYYFKPTRSVQTLSEAEYRARLDTLTTDLEKMALAMSALELTEQMVHENEVNEPVYQFISDFLVWLNEQKSIKRTLFPYLQLRLARLSGLELQIDPGQPESGTGTGYLNVESGTVSWNNPTEKALKLSNNQMKFLQKSAISKNRSLLNQNMENGEIKELVNHLDRYLRYHVEGLRPRRTDAIFDQLLKS